MGMGVGVILCWVTDASPGGWASCAAVVFWDVAALLAFLLAGYEMGLNSMGCFCT